MTLQEAGLVIAVRFWGPALWIAALGSLSKRAIGGKAYHESIGAYGQVHSGRPSIIGFGEVTAAVLTAKMAAGSACRGAPLVLFALLRNRSIFHQMF